MGIIGCVIPGAGAFEVAVHNSLLSSTFLKTVSGRARLGVQVLYSVYGIMINFLMCFTGLCRGDDDYSESSCSEFWF